MIKKLLNLIFRLSPVAVAIAKAKFAPEIAVLKLELAASKAIAEKLKADVGQWKNRK